eukprot:1220262-Rhodomonas_salina.1
MVGNSTITMGTTDAVATASGETNKITLQAGPPCRHRCKFTILNLGDYDLILGRPFMKYIRNN